MRIQQGHMRKVIAISGVPGTGKSEVAKRLAEELGATLVCIKDIIEKEKVPFKWDRERKSKAIDPKALQKAVSKNLTPGINIIEGLLAHLLKWDILVILRCDPFVLKRRLLRRKWKTSKVAENVAAEALGVITAESIGKKNVYEVDTTRLSARQAAAFIGKILKDSRLANRYMPGKIDWALKYGERSIKLMGWK